MYGGPTAPFNLYKPSDGHTWDSGLFAALNRQKIIDFCKNNRFQTQNLSVFIYVPNRVTYGNRDISKWSEAHASSKRDAGVPICISATCVSRR